MNLECGVSTTVFRRIGVGTKVHFGFARKNHHLAVINQKYDAN